MTLFALDTSIGVPLLVRRHADHDLVRRAVRKRRLCFTGHSQAETYSVLTRLPLDARLDPHDAATLFAGGFEAPLVVTASRIAELPTLLAERNIAGGAVYDALVALAVVDTDATLLTRDRRAASTYEALAVPYALVP